MSDPSSPDPCPDGQRIDSSRLVFVAGLHRSGTTPLARLLAQHPDVSGFSSTDVKEDEGQHLQDVYPAARDHGGAGRFAGHPAAHLTETSSLVTPENADRMLRSWAAHWDLSRPLLLEKSPPNLVMTRMLQAMYPDAKFVVIVRHPVVVSLSTHKWVRGRRLSHLMDHWFVAHDHFAADAVHLRKVHVVKYEDLMLHPRRELDAIGAFLGLEGPIPAQGLEGGRSSSYTARWDALAHARAPWRRIERSQIVRRFGDRAQGFGYDMEDLAHVDPWPPIEALG